jgi:hypothetical protein
MKLPYNLLGIPLPQAAALFSFMAGIVSIWVHLEISLAEVNVEIVNIKQDMLVHQAANQKDFETMRYDQHSDTKEILRKIDEIQIYLRGRR